MFGNLVKLCRKHTIKLLKMHKILIIATSQFGYNSDVFFYSKYLKNYFDVTFLGLCQDKNVVSTEGVTILNLPYRPQRFRTQIDIIKEARRLHKVNQYDSIIVFYFPFCSFLLLFISRKLLMVDIRTSFIMKENPIKETIYNWIMKFEFGLFQNRTIISKNLADYLRIKKHFTVFPLGGELPTCECLQKDYRSLHLMYIGTFYDRKIDITIRGFYKFLQKNKGKVSINYTIIGFGSDMEKKQINDTINELDLGKFVNFIGEVRFPDTIKYFQQHNVGVSFIPLTKYYDCQPPTKTFEYLLYGLPVIATKTLENRIVINSSNGVLIEDTVDGFCDGIEQIIRNKDKFNTLLIQNNSTKYSWSSIVDNILKPYIEGKVN